MHLPHPVNISHIPHIQTVVIIYTAEPVADGVVGNSNGIWVTGILLDGKQMSDGREIRGIVKSREITASDASVREGDVINL